MIHLFDEKLCVIDGFYTPIVKFMYKLDIWCVIDRHLLLEERKPTNWRGIIKIESLYRIWSGNTVRV